MYRYESDYIMRMINLLRQLFAYLWGITDAQQRDKGLEAIAQAMGQLTGLTPDAALNLSPDQLCQMLGQDGEGLARCYALAELLRAQGELYERFDLPLDAERCLRKALAMYVRAVGIPQELLRQSYTPTYQLFGRFFSEMGQGDYRAAGEYFEELGDLARAEDAYCALEDPSPAHAFYLRLLPMQEGALIRCGLTMQEVREGYARILRIAGGPLAP